MLYRLKLPLRQVLLHHNITDYLHSHVFPPLSLTTCNKVASISMSSNEFKVSDTFCINDYNCIGFDLDNTLVRYYLGPQVNIEYHGVVKYLIDNKGYDPKLARPMEDNLEFLRKGLIMDVEGGNLLQLSSDGVVQKASHGTRMLNQDAIKTIYGPDMKWNITSQILDDIMAVYTKPLLKKMRLFADYFDLPSALVSMRIVDLLDENNGGPLPKYNYWPDVLEALIYMYSTKHFVLDVGGYFPLIKKNPEKYVRKQSAHVLLWLKELKRVKTIFLISNSFVDYASCVAEAALGEKWRDLFDIVIFNAQKPGFFNASSKNNEFYVLDGNNENKLTSMNDLVTGTDKMYSQGNWPDLFSLFKQETGNDKPRCVYFGDHISQDVYAPTVYTQCCDTVAVFEEAGAEGSNGSNYPDVQLLTSSIWGSFFHHESQDSGDNNNIKLNTLFGYLIQKHSRICISELENIAVYPLDYRFKSFVDGNIDAFLPSCPKSIV